MRLRQAHAIFTVAEHLTQAINHHKIPDADVAICQYPTEHDDPALAHPASDDDYLNIDLEVACPDHPAGAPARHYLIEATADPDDDHIDLTLDRGYPGDADHGRVLEIEPSVVPVDDEDMAFRDDIGATVASRIIAAIIREEQAHRAAYLKRIGGVS